MNYFQFCYKFLDLVVAWWYFRIEVSHLYVIAQIICLNMCDIFRWLWLSSRKCPLLPEYVYYYYCFCFQYFNDLCSSMFDSTVLIRTINITMFVFFEIYMWNVCSLCCIAYFLICVTSFEDYGYPQGVGHPFPS